MKQALSKTASRLREAKPRRRPEGKQVKGEGLGWRRIVMQGKEKMIRKQQQWSTLAMEAEPGVVKCA